MHKLYEKIEEAYHELQRAFHAVDCFENLGKEANPRETFTPPVLRYLFVDRRFRMEIFEYPRYRRAMAEHQIRFEDGAEFFCFRRHKLEVIVVDKPGFLLVV